MYTAKFTGVSIFAGHLFYVIYDPKGEFICTLAVPDFGTSETDVSKVPQVAALLAHLNRS